MNSWAALLTMLLGLSLVGGEVMTLNDVASESIHDQQLLRQLQMPTTSTTTTKTSWQLLGEPLASGTSAQNRQEWGKVVILSRDGQTVAVGAPSPSYHDKDVDSNSSSNNNNNNIRGSVHVFRYHNKQHWEPLGQEILSDNIQWGGQLALSADGNVLAVSDPQLGIVRVYDYNVQSSKKWSPRGSDLHGETMQDRFGASLSLSDNGNRLAVGAPDNIAEGQYGGHVRVYQWRDDVNEHNDNGKGNSGKTSEWVQMGGALNGTGQSNSHAVSLSSDGLVLAIGDPRAHSKKKGHYVGRVNVYHFNQQTNDWESLGDALEGSEAYDFMGSAVSLSADGRVLAVGSSVRHAGRVHVFYLAADDKQWKLKGSVLEAAPGLDQFGSTVSLSSDGSVVAVGAIWYQFLPETAQEARQVRVYSWNQGDWQLYTLQETQDDNDDDAQPYQGRLGSAISLSGDGTRVAVGGARLNSELHSASAVHVYQLDHCPLDPMKTKPGVCGCGVIDLRSDTDGDGVVDCLKLSLDRSEEDDDRRISKGGRVTLIVLLVLFVLFTCARFCGSSSSGEQRQTRKQSRVMSDEELERRCKRRRERQLRSLELPPYDREEESSYSGTGSSSSYLDFVPEEVDVADPTVISCL